jgi:hypothetical protein
MAFAMGGAVVVGGECGTAGTGRLRREGRCHGIRLCGPGRGYALGSGGGGFQKNTGGRAPGGRFCAYYFHLSSRPSDLDPMVLIGVCIVCTCGLVST